MLAKPKSMKTNNYYSFLMACLLISAGLIFTSCDDDSPPADPTLTISDDALTADLGETVTVTVDGDVPGNFNVMRITKFIGTNIDTDYGTGGTVEVGTGLPYTFNYTIGTNDIEEPIRFQFEVEDDNGNTGSTNLIITLAATRAQLLVSFNWRYSSLIFDGMESILPCEEDNIYSFEADGTMSVDYGAITGSGGGSCDFDGVTVPVEWEMNAAMDTLYWYRDNFSVMPAVREDTVTYAIVSFDNTAWNADETNLFVIFIYTYSAVPK
jgi:hypothetical protein